MGVPEVPIWALTHLTHASLQRTAERCQADLLHIKGPATRLSLRDGRHDSSDADVLVRPAHLDRFLDALVTDGWTLFTGFDEGSPFGHAANFEHPSWTYADVHRQVPGPRVTPEEAFERLWRDHETADIGHRPCPVLSVTGQVVVQTLHTARSHGTERAEAWDLSAPELRAQAWTLARELGADAAFAAGMGDLDAHQDAPDHALWEYWSQPEQDRLDEWSARYRSATTAAERREVIRQALHVNRTHLRIRLGHEPSRPELLREQYARLTLGIRSMTRHLRRGRSDS